MKIEKEVLWVGGALVATTAVVGYLIYEVFKKTEQTVESPFVAIGAAWNQFTTWLSAPSAEQAANAASVSPYTQNGDSVLSPFNATTDVGNSYLNTNPPTDQATSAADPTYMPFNATGG